MLKTSLLCLFLATLHAETASPDQIRSAATRAIAIVQRGATGFYKSQDCFSCHDHGLPMLAFRVAREHGVAVDETAANQVATKGLLAGPDLSSIDRAVQDIEAHVVGREPAECVAGGLDIDLLVVQSFQS